MRRPGTMLGWVFKTASTLIALSLPAGLAGAPPGPVAAGQSYGFTAEEVQQVMGGAVLSKGLPEKSDKELAGVVAILFPQTVAELATTLLEGQWLKADATIRALHVWKPEEPAAGVFAAMQLEPGDRAETERFLRAAPGSALNLADAEMARFRRLGVQPGAAGAARAVNATLQALLRARYDAYRKEGLKGILPYARGGQRKASPGSDLALAIEASIPANRYPGCAGALLHYPSRPLAAMEHRFFCYRQEVEDRPAFILSHRAGVRGEQAALIVELRYYVGHTYDGRFIASDCIAAPGGTLLFYVNRTFTDQVAGLASGLRHGIGRKRMLADVSANLKRWREARRK